MKRLTMYAALLISLITLVACNSSKQSTTSESGKHYHLKGKVVSIDHQAHMVNVDGEAIPGFMSAMTMPYNVKPESQLDKLSPGDSIAADVVVQSDSAWLENIAVTGHGESQGKH